MDSEDDRIRQINYKAVAHKAMNYWTNSEVYTSLFLSSTEVMEFLEYLVANYKSLLFTIESDQIEVQLAGAFSNPNDLAPIEKIMETMVEIWEQSPSIIN
jgi:hypothetical protein